MKVFVSIVSHISSIRKLSLRVYSVRVRLVKYMYIVLLDVNTCTHSYVWSTKYSWVMYVSQLDYF